MPNFGASSGALQASEVSERVLTTHKRSSLLSWRARSGAAQDVTAGDAMVSDAIPGDVFAVATSAAMTVPGFTLELKSNAVSARVSAGAVRVRTVMRNIRCTIVRMNGEGVGMMR